MPVEVRQAVDGDLTALTEIYNHYVVHGAATFDTAEFTVDTRRSWFEHHRADGPYRLLVAADDDSGAVVGYAASTRFRDRPAYDRSVETSLYLRPDSCGRGIGTSLYRRLFGALRGEQLHRAYAVIALPNDASLALHDRFGFRTVGTLSEVGHKFGRYWDVQWLERALP